MIKKIQSITYRDDHGMDNEYFVGKNGVNEIMEHFAGGEGDRWFYDVVFDDRVVRLFSFQQVVFVKDETDPYTTF
jgi:phage-related protein